MKTGNELKIKTSEQNAKPISTPDCQLQAWLQQVHQHDVFWKEKSDTIYERKLSLTDPKIVRINHIRQAFRFYIIPALEQALNASGADQAEFASYMESFFSETHFNQFLGHLYSVRKEPEGQWDFLEMDPFEQEASVLYDLYKARKTIEQSEALIREIQEASAPFPSRFTKEKQLSLVQGFRRALLMMFKQSLKPEYHRKIFDEIHPAFVSVSQVEQRRQNRVLYCLPHNSEGSRYRRIVLHILFRKHIKTQIKGKPTLIRYNLVEYERVKREYLSYWVQNLGEHPEKLKVYRKISFQNKSFAEWIAEDFDKESALLENLSSEEFNDVMGEIQQNVEPEHQSPVDPLSEKHSTFSELNGNFKGLLAKVRTRLNGGPSVRSSNSLLNQLAQASLGISSGFPPPVPPVTTEPLPSTEAVFPLYQHERPSLPMGDRVLLVIHPDWIESFRTLLSKKEWYVSDPFVEVFQPKEVTLQDLKKAGLVVTCRCQLPAFDNNGLALDVDKFGAAIVDMELPLTSYPLPSRLSNQLKALKLEIELNEANPLLAEKYQEDIRLWNIQQSIRSHQIYCQALRSNMKESLESYQNLIHWLVLEALEASGHKQALLSALLKVSRCLIVDGFARETKNHLAKVGMEKKLLTAWDVNDLREQRGTESTVEDFLNRPSFEKYDLVLFTDWESCQPGLLPVYLRARFLDTSIAAEEQVQIYKLNLFEVFRQPEQYLERCQRRLLKAGGSVSRSKLSSRSLDVLCRQWTQVYAAEHQLTTWVQQLNKLQERLQTVPKHVQSFDFAKHLQHHLLNRIGFLVLSFQDR